jgi:hypothetical protein
MIPALAAADVWYVGGGYNEDGYMGERMSEDFYNWLVTEAQPGASYIGVVAVTTNTRTNCGCTDLNGCLETMGRFFQYSGPEGGDDPYLWHPVVFITWLTNCSGGAQTRVQCPVNTANKDNDYDENTSDLDGDGVVDADDYDPHDATVTGNPNDVDGDGIPNDVDPYPENDETFTWQIEQVGYDAAGDPCYWYVELSNGERCEIGDIDDVDGYTYVQIPPEQMTYQDWIDTFGSGGTSPGYTLDPDVQHEIVNYTGADPTSGGDTGIVGGSDSTGNTTEMDHLSDIVNNTNGNLENQGRQTEYLRSINERIGNLTAITAENQSGSGSAAGGDITVETPTADEIGNAVGDEIENMGTEQTFDDESDTKLAEFEAEANDEMELSDIPTEHQERTSIDDEMDSLSSSIDDSAITGSGVSSSAGSCSFTWDYNGNPIEFAICGYETQLASWGTIIQSIVALHCIMIVFRKN